MPENPNYACGTLFGLLMVCSITLGWAKSNKLVLIKEKIDLRKELINIASSQIGVTEATGKNDGKDVYKYQKNIGLRPGASWCAAFAVWSLDSLKRWSGIDIKYPRSGIAANMVKTKLVYVRGKTKEFEFKKGMIAGEGYNSVTHNAIIVEKWDNFHYVTIGGNESNKVQRSVKHIKNLIRVSDYLAEP